MENLHVIKLVKVNIGQIFILFYFCWKNAELATNK